MKRLSQRVAFLTVLALVLMSWAPSTDAGLKELGLVVLNVSAHDATVDVAVGNLLPFKSSGYVVVTARSTSGKLMRSSRFVSLTGGGSAVVAVDFGLRVGVVDLVGIADQPDPM